MNVAHLCLASFIVATIALTFGITAMATLVVLLHRRKKERVERYREWERQQQQIGLQIAKRDSDGDPLFGRSHK